MFTAKQQRLLVLSFAVAFCFQSLPVHPAEKDEKWVLVESPNFTVVSNAGEKQARRTAEQFELFRATVKMLMGTMRTDPGQPVIVLAAKNEKSMKVLLPGYWERKDQVHPAGLFVPGPEKHYAVLQLDARGEKPYEVLYHEYDHLVISLNFVDMPTWLNEGFADFYANADLGSRQATLGRPSESSLYQLQREKLLPLEVLFTVDHKSPYYNERNKVSIFYAQSWAVTHYLMLGDDRAHVNMLTTYLKETQRGADSLEAARRCFGDLKALQKTSSAMCGSPVIFTS